MLKKILLYSVLFYAVSGFLIVPYFLKSQIINSVQQETNARLDIQSVYFNPFIFKLQVSGIELKTLDNAQLLSLDSLTLDLEAYSLLYLAIHVKELILKEPSISLVYSKDKQLNLGSIMKERMPKESAEEDTNTTLNLPRIILERIAVVNAKVHYEDYTNPSRFDFSFDNLGFELKDIDTNDFNSSHGRLRFYSMLGDGGFIDLKSEITGLRPLGLKGDLSFEASKLYTQWRYLQDSLNLEVANGKISLNAEYTLNQDDLNATSIDNINVYLDGLRIKPKHTHKDVLNLRSLYIEDASIKPFLKDIRIKRVGLDSLAVQVKRDEDSQIDWLEYIKNKSTESEQNSSSSQSASVKNGSKEEYRIRLNHFALQSAMLEFDDAMSGAKTTIDKVDLNAYDIDSQAKSWLNYEVSLRINGAGYAKARGKLRHTPLKQEGRFELQKVALKGLSPYIEENAYLSLDDGYLSVKLNTKYDKSKYKPDLYVDGSVKMEEVFLSDSRDGASLVSFSEIGLNSFTLEMFPNRLYIDEVDINSFFVNAVIDENKSMNLSSLLKNKSSEASEKKAEKKKAKSDEKKEDFPVKIAKVNVAMGSAKFADLSLPIRFSTHIHDLNGAVYSVSNAGGETSTVNINGEVDRYGAVSLKGSLNSGNPKAYTDLKLNFKNLELNSLSGYSASFAGYKIDEGKLYLDLGYHIVDSKLKGQNSIVMKKIKLGDTIEDENISRLPLGFVIALLEDSEGIVDIDMPVEGNVDEPDFKYGALVWKTLGNLIVKAVASPFKFLGSMMGIDGEQLEYAEFEAGESLILAPEMEKLDNIAKMLEKRPKISLNIGGRYDTGKDIAALQRQKLIDLVVLKSGIKNRDDHESAMSVDLLEGIYQDFRDDKRPQTISKELAKKYKGDSYKAEYLKALVQECSSLQQVPDAELEALAKSRAQSIHTYLVNIKSIGQERVLMSEIGRAEMQEDSKWVKTKLEIEVK